VIINGIIHGIDGPSNHTALAIKFDRIVLVGSESEVIETAGSNTKVMDLNGRMIIPGFIDTHIHPSMAGELFINSINFKTLQPNSIQSFQDIVRSKTVHAYKDEWILGWGYDEERFIEGRHPTRLDLDDLTLDNPVFITHTCGHVAVCNSKALKLAGIEENTSDPKQGIIDRDEYGMPTGTLRNRAQQLVKQHIPPQNHNHLKNSLRLACEKLASMGVTSIHDAWAGSNIIKAYQELLSDGNLPLRVGLMPPIANPFEGDYLQQLTSLGLGTGFGNSMLRIVGAKVALDGMIRSQTAALKEGYEANPNNHGLITIDIEPLFEKIRICNLFDIRACIHAEGDRGIDTALNAIESALDYHFVDGHRHRIEHFGLSTSDQMRRMKKLGVIPSVSINFINDIGEGYMKELGPERCEWIYPLKSLLENDIVASCNSDWPVSVCNPIIGLYSAVSRKTWKDSYLGSSQSISLKDAIKAYTWNGAYASFEEGIKGSIEEGKLADLVVLSENPYKTPIDKLPKIKVDITIVGGKIVYQR